MHVQEMHGAVAFIYDGHQTQLCDWAMSHRNYDTKHTLVHITATVSQVIALAEAF